MPRGGLGPTAAFAILAALLLATPGMAPAIGTAGPTADGADPAPAYDAAWASSAERGLAWSSVHQEELVAPLVGGAGLAGWTDATITAYRQGQAWAGAHLETADRAQLTDVLAELLAPHDIERDELATDEVPEAFVAPIATLVAAQQTAATMSQPPSPDAGPWASAQQGATASAWLLGALDATVPALEAAADQAPPEPLPLDPLGLVILGSQGDDTYEPATLEPLTIQGPLVSVEPGGNDTYDVPIAAPIHVDFPPDPVFGFHGAFTYSGALAVDLAGDDDYNKRVAAGQYVEAVHLLLDRRGNDTYGDLTIEDSIASSEEGSAILLDRGGNDTYEAFDRSIAYARANHRTNTYAVSVLGDWKGDDVYEASQDQPGRASWGRTHASADNAGAIAILRDYEGDDDHSADIFTHANTDDGGISQYVDDRGKESIFIDHLGGSLGWRAESEGGVRSSPGDRGLAYYLDGGGEDSFTWNKLDDPLDFGNNLTRVEGDDPYPYSVFVDCPDPTDTVVPCQANQSNVLTKIAQNEVEAATGSPLTSPAVGNR